MLNGTWALDFMHDALYGGRAIWILNVIDEALAMEVGSSIPAPRVVRKPTARLARRNSAGEFSAAVQHSGSVRFLKCVANGEVSGLTRREGAAAVRQIDDASV
jgi:hypothetical protein